MEKLLLIGINTRSMIESALKLDYTVYSTSYFSTSDVPVIKNQKIILNETEDKNCGVFEDKFNSRNILDISKDYFDEVDYIIPVSGISPNDFKKKYQKKILGNKDVNEVEDKYQFYKKIKNKFLTPETFCVNDIDEAIEIQKNNPNVKYIVKPRSGSGGYNTKVLNNSSQLQLNEDEKLIVQEYINGINLSSSVLASKKEAKTIINSRLLTQHDFKNNNQFKYIGNILPLTKKSILTKVKNIDEINKKMETISEKLIQKFKLIGSNGVDYILNKNGLYALEINPRIQGTFECCQQSLGINMLEAHIKACQNKIIDINKPKFYSYKKIIYSPQTTIYEKINLNNIYDTPHLGSITQKDEPLLTIIDKDKDFNKLYEKVEKASQIVNKLAKKSK
ncbi:ATP-grasp domain-containing protein [uncultured Methanobrevibacter sp.]|uniref:ATP-grasp domain-containing protein n=1 Tax=uncultured Methanobrevibacter sp. TaxID=253161 RepID=UPI00261DE473|nr:ATP-grasp domain-containing protein [uncultured Methanobrevibacter sp.]